MLEPSSGQATTTGPGTPLLAGIAGAAVLLVRAVDDLLGDGEPDGTLVGRLRGSVLLLGPLLARRGRATGDGESERPILPTTRGNRPEGPRRGKGTPGHETAGGKDDGDTEP